MIKGVTESEEKIIKSILSSYPYEFYAYGSRVNGDYTKSSDLDILLKSKENISTEIIDEIEMKFNQSVIPYIVNISNYQNMNKDFYKLIEASLIKL